MKRIILLVISIAIPAILFSQSAHFSFGQEINGTWHPVANGGSITFSLKSSTTFQDYVAVRNETSSLKKLYLKKYYVKRASQSFMDLFCWDVCYTDPNVMASKHTVDFRALTTDSITFHLSYDPQNHEGETVVRYKMWDASDPNDSAYITIHYVSSLSGLRDETAVSSVMASPNPCNTSVVFTIPGNNESGSVLHMFDLLGNKIREIRCQSGNHEISTDVSAFPAGVYLYFIEQNGLRGSVRKLMIQR